MLRGGERQTLSLCCNSKCILQSGVKAGSWTAAVEEWRRVHYGMTLTQADLLRRIRLQNETCAFFLLNSHSPACNEILTHSVRQLLKLQAQLAQRLCKCAITLF